MRGRVAQPLGGGSISTRKKTTRARGNDPGSLAQICSNRCEKMGAESGRSNLRGFLKRSWQEVLKSRNPIDERSPIETAQVRDNTPDPDLPMSFGDHVLRSVKIVEPKRAGAQGR